MKTFRDTAGREWAITVDVNAIKRVMKAPIEYLGEPLKVNLLELVDPDGELLKKVVAYPPLVCDIAYALCKPQADAQKVSDEDFGRAMAGDAIDAAATAFLEELACFFPKGRRDLLRKALAKLRTLETIALSAANTRLDSPDLENQLLEMIRHGGASAETAAGGSVGSSPALSGSTPAP